MSLEGVGDRLSKGLDKAAGLEVGRGYLEATAGLHSIGGAFARLELGARPLQQLEVFGYGQITAPLPALQPSFPVTVEAGVGARVRW